MKSEKKGVIVLKNTFSHIVNKNIEREIWRQNIYSWEDFLENHHKVQIKDAKKHRLVHEVQRSLDAFNKKDFSYFVNNLKEHWRAYPELKNKCCFLDIETTGLSRYHDDVTLIGLYDGNESRIFINGVDLEEFNNEIKKYDMIVTYNGKCFDVPFIKAKFPDIDFNKLHVDLRFDMRKIGYNGGLKAIERMVGINRDSEVQDIGGFEAVRLWYRYLKGDKGALDLLIKYNKADIENLKTLMDFTYQKLKEEEFLSQLQ